MGKAAREHEPAAVESFLPASVCRCWARSRRRDASRAATCCGSTEDAGRGQGYRTNAEGIRQLRALLADAVDEVEVVPLPHWRGPASCLHLMSFISLIDRDLALVYSPLMPVPFRESLLARGFTLVEVPDEELETWAATCSRWRRASA